MFDFVYKITRLVANDRTFSNSCPVANDQTSMLILSFSKDIYV